MTVGSALFTTVTFKKETAFGVKDTDTDGAILFSRLQFTPKLDQSVVLSKEIKRSMQSGNYDRGVKTVTATLSGEMEAGAHAAAWASLFRQDFNTGVVSDITGTDISATANVANLTTTGTDWTTALQLDPAVGDTIIFSGFTGTNKSNNGREWTILASAAGSLTLRPKSGRFVMFADAAGESVTVQNLGTDAAPKTNVITRTNIASVADTPIFATVAGDFTVQFVVGNLVKASGFTGGNAPNNEKPFKITKITATQLYGYYTDNSLAIDDAATESVTITASDLVKLVYASTNSLAVATTTRLTSSTSFIAEGFKVHDVIRLRGFTTATNNDRNLLVTSFNTAGTQMNFVVLDGDVTTVPMVVEAGASGDYVYRVGKKTFIPQDDHTNYSWMSERWDSSITQSEQYTGLRFGQGKITGANADIPTVSFDLMGKDLETAQAEYYTSSAEPISSKNLSVIFAKAYIDATAIGSVLSNDITVNNNNAALDKTWGSDTTADITPGVFSVKGSMQIYYQNETERDRYLNKNEMSIVFVLRDSDDYDAEFVAIQMPRIIYDSAAISDDLKASIITIPFTAIENPTGSDGVDASKLFSSISIQDSKA